MRALFDSIDSLGRAMTFYKERHTVLASNLANLNTPGFKPADLVRIEQPAAATQQLAVTDPRHIQPTEASTPIRTEAVIEAGETAGRDENSVSLERELAKISANRVQYGASSELITRRLAMLRYAATDGSA